MCGEGAGSMPLSILAGVSFLQAWVLFSPSATDTEYRRPAPEDGMAAWSGPQAWNLSEVAILWSLPPESIATDGLGGGITWAMAPWACDALLPKFPERKMDTIATFLDCRDLRNAIRAAFSTWSLNHARLTFVDVSDSCTSNDWAANSSCPAAEIVLYTVRLLAATRRAG